MSSKSRGNYPVIANICPLCKVVHYGDNQLCVCCIDEAIYKVEPRREKR